MAINFLHTEFVFIILFSVLNLLDSQIFKGHWSETGTPSFLIDLLKQRQFDLSNLEQISVDLQSFISFDIEDLLRCLFFIKQAISPSNHFYHKLILIF